MLGPPAKEQSVTSAVREVQLDRLRKMNGTSAFLKVDSCNVILLYCCKGAAISDSILSRTTSEGPQDLTLTSNATLKDEHI